MNLKHLNRQAERMLATTVVPALVVKHGGVDAACLSEYRALKQSLLRRLAGVSSTDEASRLVVIITNEEETNMATKKAKKTETKAKPEKKKAEVVTTDHGEFRPNSVLLEIYRCFDKKSGMTKLEIVEHLKAKFPERDAEGMATTVGIQINRMPDERKFKLGRDDKGRYSIHIEGRSTVRVLSPEAAKAKAEKEAAKEKAKADKAAEKAKKEQEKAAAKAKVDKEKADAAAKKAAEAAEEAKKKAAALAKQGVTLKTVS